MSEEKKLLPCPMCGADPELSFGQRSNDFVHAVECKCGLRMKVSDNYCESTAEAAIAAWNRRAPVSVAIPPERKHDMHSIQTWVWGYNKCREEMLAAIRAAGITVREKV